MVLACSKVILDSQPAQFLSVTPPPSLCMKGKIKDARKNTIFLDVDYLFSTASNVALSYSGVEPL